jgi:hypothetical protein
MRRECNHWDMIACRVSTDWISYNYLKAQHLIAGCKTEIIELLSDRSQVIVIAFPVKIKIR